MRDKLDKSARPSDLVTGDLVYYYDPPPPSADYISKLSSKYKGPFRIIQTVDDHLLRLREVSTDYEIPHLVNVQKVKRAYTAFAPANDYNNKTSQAPKRARSLPRVTDDDPLSGQIQPRTIVKGRVTERPNTRYNLRGLPDKDYNEDSEKQ